MPVCLEFVWLELPQIYGISRRQQNSRSKEGVKYLQYISMSFYDAEAEINNQYKFEQLLRTLLMVQAVKYAQR